MNYGRCNEPVECRSVGELCSEKSVPAARPSEPLNEMVKGAGAIGMDILLMAERIEENLVGAGNVRENKPGNPTCFRDALAMHNDSLLMTAEILSRICALLGI